jgi:integrase
LPTKSITKRTVDESQPGERAMLTWDDKLKGFGLLVLPSGVKSYVFQYRIGGRAGKTKRYTIGRHGSPWTPDQARKVAEGLAQSVRLGIDPAEAERERELEKRRAKEEAAEEQRRILDLAFSAYAERWLADGLDRETRPRTRAGYQAVLRNHVVPVLGDKPLPTISKADVRKVLEGIPADQPAVRRLAFAVMRPLFQWAKSRDDIASSPLEGVAQPSSAASRDRVLSDGELALALRAAAQLDRPFCEFYAGLEWGELDRASSTWTLPAKRSKNAQASIIPLNRPAIAALDRLAGQHGADKPKWPRKGLVLSTTGKTPISGYSRAKARLDSAMLALARADAEKAGEDPSTVTLEPWRLHDARRTLATGLQRLGVRFEVTEAVLNHISGASRSGIAAVYQRHNWADEKRAALDAWANHLDRILNPDAEAANVLPLRVANRSPG